MILENLRYATPEEIAAFADKADLSPNTTVIAFPNGEKLPDFAVLRNAWEVDPVFYSPETSGSRKVMFLVLLENLLKFGPPQANSFYFNVAADNEPWKEILKKIGAEPISPQPEIRFKKVIR